MLSSEEIALELVKITKAQPVSQTSASPSAIELYETYVKKVYEAYETCSK